MMNDEQLLRYSRHIMLPEVGIDGQKKLLNSTVLIIGLGGLGSPSALYLAASGIGKLIIADFDQVELSNLQRQIIHHTHDIGTLKVESAFNKLHAINPEVIIKKLSKVDENALSKAIKAADIVLDGTDNFQARFLINRLCVGQQKPLVSAAVIRFEGQISVFKGWLAQQPCYQCLYSPDGDEDNNCSTNGVLAPMAAVIGSIQALQTIKTLLNLSEQLIGKLMVIDGLTLNFRTLNISHNDNCAICSTNHQLNKTNC